VKSLSILFIVLGMPALVGAQPTPPPAPPPPKAERPAAPPKAATPPAPPTPAPTPVPTPTPSWVKPPKPPKPPKAPKPPKVHVHIGDDDDDDDDHDFDFDLQVDLDDHYVPHFKLDGKEVDVHELTRRAMEMSAKATKMGGKWHNFAKGPHAGTNPTPVKVKGTVRLRAEAINQGFDVTAGATAEVSATCPGGGVAMSVDGDEVEVEVDWPGSCGGPIKIGIPTGSSVQISTTNGNIKLGGSYGDVEVEAVNGQVTVDRAGDVKLETVNGGVKIADASGRVSLQTVSGDVEVTMSSPAPRLQYETTSGSLKWRGTCGKGCRIDAETFSGDIDLQLDKKSTFGTRFSSRSGDVKDTMGMKVERTDKDYGSVHVRGSYGTGEGSIRVETYSGSLKLNPR
jgi:DUF4097 and DUF4098 domain-containing protein YvlB